MFPCNVSNPAQNRPRGAVMLKLAGDARRKTIVRILRQPGPRTKSPSRGEKRRWIDGNRPWSVPQSAPQEAGTHFGFVEEASRRTYAACPGSPIAKDVSILRVNHAAQKDMLPRVREVAHRGSTGAPRCKMSMGKGDSHTLDNFHCAVDSMASRFQPPRGRRADPLTAGSSISGLSH